MKKFIGQIGKKQIILVTIPKIQYHEEWNNTNGFSVVLLYDQDSKESPLPFFDFARGAVMNGARVLIVAGKNAEQIHDLFDEEICDLQMNGLLNLKDDESILTIYLEKKSISDIIDESLFTYQCNDVFFVALENDNRIDTLIKIIGKHSSLNKDANDTENN